MMNVPMTGCSSSFSVGKVTLISPDAAAFLLGLSPSTVTLFLLLSLEVILAGVSIVSCMCGVCALLG